MGMYHTYISSCTCISTILRSCLAMPGWDPRLWFAHSVSSVHIQVVPSCGQRPPWLGLLPTHTRFLFVLHLHTHIYISIYLHICISTILRSCLAMPGLDPRLWFAHSASSVHIQVVPSWWSPRWSFWLGLLQHCVSVYQ